MKTYPSQLGLGVFCFFLYNQLMGKIVLYLCLYKASTTSAATTKAYTASSASTKASTDSIH